MQWFWPVKTLRYHFWELQILPVTDPNARLCQSTLKLPIEKHEFLGLEKTSLYIEFFRSLQIQTSHFLVFFKVVSWFSGIFSKCTIIIIQEGECFRYSHKIAKSVHFMICKGKTQWRFMRLFTYITVFLRTILPLFCDDRAHWSVYFPDKECCSKELF